MKTISILAIVISVATLVYVGFGIDRNGVGVSTDSSGVFGQKSSFTATTTAVGTSAGIVLDANFNADVRFICLHPNHYASSTVYLNLASSTSRSVVGGGIPLASTTQTCVVFDRDKQYGGTIYGIAPAATIVVTGEY